MFQISQNASTHLAQLLAEQPGTSVEGLRIAVENGGCAGLQYVLSLDSEREGDHIFPCKGGLVFIDGESFSCLEGSILEYEGGGLSGNGFRIQNPRASRHCGCGTSFEAHRD